MPEKSFDELMNGYINNQLTDEETDYFMALVQQPAYQEKIEAYIGHLLDKRSITGLSNDLQGQAVFQKILSAAYSQTQEQETIPTTKSRVVWMKYAAAAAVLIALLSTTYIWMSRSPAPKVATKPKEHQYKNDVLPGTQKAVLTLADGSVITLDNAQNGTLAKQGGTTVIKLDGTINYANAKADDGQILYNTIATPPASQYQVVLPDGTQVWLNAASSIHFPTRFSGADRVVSITGEAYFEVTKNKTKPFIVNVNGSQVKVLGTHFNINSYGDEHAIKTTLLEGKVEVGSQMSDVRSQMSEVRSRKSDLRPQTSDFRHRTSVILQPGEQAIAVAHSPLTINRSPNLEEVMSWKNGLFQFNNAAIQPIIRQLARWYNLEVKYNKLPDDNLYYLEMPRNSKLSSILKVLELTGNIHFEIEGNKLIVS